MRVDPLTGAVVRVVPERQERPDQPAGCPFCVGGLESPEPYVVRSFPNRWPSFDGDRCEVVLYGPEHGRSLAALGVERARQVVDLWAARTEALGGRDDVAYVLVFENHGAEVGATIDHPHGQLFAFDHVPPAPLQELRSGRFALGDERIVHERDGWRAWVPAAPVFPHQVRLAPVEQRPDLPSLGAVERDGLAAALVHVLGRFEAAFDPPMPYMLWWHQRPTDGGDWADAWLHLEIVSPWRSQSLPRYIAAGELGSGLFINPVDPDDAWRRLR